MWSTLAELSKNSAQAADPKISAEYPSYWGGSPAQLAAGNLESLERQLKEELGQLMRLRLELEHLQVGRPAALRCGMQRLGAPHRVIICCSLLCYAAPHGANVPHCAVLMPCYHWAGMCWRSDAQQLWRPLPDLPALAWEAGCVQAYVHAMHGGAMQEGRMAV